MDKTEDKKKKQKKIHGTVVKVTDENVEEVAKDLVEKFRKLRRERKGH
jgi:fructose-1,6-bisphosphatase/inositol monophosphatase family enzyme